MNAAALEGAAETAVARYDRRRAWYRRWLWIIIPLNLTITILLGCGPALALTLMYHGAGWIGQPWAMPLLLGTVIAVMAGSLVWSSRFYPPKQFYTDAVLAPRSDNLQRMRWRLILFVTAMLGAELAIMTPMWTLFPRLRAGSLPAWLPWLALAAEVLIPALLALMLLVWLLGGRLSGPAALQRAMDDELTHVHRARAMTAGFLVLLGAVIILMATMAFLPNISIEIGLAACAYLGLGAASVRFALLERGAQMAARDD